MHCSRKESQLKKENSIFLNFNFVLRRLGHYSRNAYKMHEITPTQRNEVNTNECGGKIHRNSVVFDQRARGTHQTVILILYTTLKICGACNREQVCHHKLSSVLCDINILRVGVQREMHFRMLQAKR